MATPPMYLPPDGGDERWMTREGRVAMVHEWQRTYGMEPRDDSRLTQLFADGHIHMPPDQIARELMATDFIYKHTLYGDLIEEFLRSVAARVRREYRTSWKATWNIVRFYGPVALKLICLQMAHVGIPQVMPPAK